MDPFKIIAIYRGVWYPDTKFKYRFLDTIFFSGLLLLMIWSVNLESSYFSTQDMLIDTLVGGSTRKPVNNTISSETRLFTRQNDACNLSGMSVPKESYSL